MARPRLPLAEHAATSRAGFQLRRNVAAPDEWWERVERYAADHGLTLAAALRMLVDLGLEEAS